MTRTFIHPTALVETASLGAGTSIHAFTHVQAGAIVGADCNIADHCFIEAGAHVGHGCTIKNGVSIWDGIELGDGVFVGPGALFTNDRWPRSRRLAEAASRYETDEWRLPTCVGRGASIGAGAIVLPGIVIGAYAMVAAGAVVTRDVPPGACVTGVPAVPVGSVCRCGLPLDEEKGLDCGNVETVGQEHTGAVR